eukprot:103040-Amphidinium_carterae.1
MGLVPSSTLWRCTKAVYGRKESPKMWEVHRDKVLSEFEWTHHGKKHFLQQSYRHPSMWYVLESKTKPPKIKPTCLDDGETVWDVATPEYLTGQPEDVESIRFLGMEIEKDNKTNDWI